MYLSSFTDACTMDTVVVVIVCQIYPFLFVWKGSFPKYKTVTKLNTSVSRSRSMSSKHDCSSPNNGILFHSINTSKVVVVRSLPFSLGTTIVFYRYLDIYINRNCTGLGYFLGSQRNSTIATSRTIVNTSILKDIASH